MSESSDSEFDDLAKAIGAFKDRTGDVSDEEKSAKSSGSDSGSENESDEEIPEEVKKPKRRRIDPEEQKELDKFLFGDKEGLIKNLEGNQLFFNDVTGSASQEEGIKEAECLWEDSDDEDFKQSSFAAEARSKRKFERILGNNPKWASLDNKKEEDDSSDEDVISKSVGHLAKDKTSKDLPKGELAYKRLRDMNKSTLREGRITSVQFHPKSTVGIVAGLKGLVSMFAIDGRENKKIHSIKYEKYPIHSCKLNNEGDELTMGSNDPYFHTYNLLSGHKQRTRLPRGITSMKSFELSECGKYMAIAGANGEIHLLHSMTKELLCSLKQEYQSTSLSFSKDSKRLFSHSDDNEVTIFDLRTQRVENRFVDDGCVNGSSVEISSNGQLVATGSRQGFVNIYNYEDVIAKKNPQPVKVVSNLTTEITDLKFNQTSEMLAICSSDMKNAVKIVHFPSGTVFDNFPRQLDSIGSPTCIAFSPLGGYMSFGTISGNVPLYRLRHYNNY